MQWKLTHSQGCYDLDMTPDGQWLVMIDMFDNRAIVYRWDEVLGFTDNQPNLYSGSVQTPRSCAISDDHEYLFMGRSTGNLYVYKFNTDFDVF